MVVVNLPSENIYYDLYSLSGIANTKTVLVNNTTSHYLEVIQSPTQPSPDDNGALVKPDEDLFVQGSTASPLWVKGGNKGPIVVQVAGLDSLTNHRGVDPAVYVGLQALTTQPFVEINCKNGLQYEASFYTAALAAGSHIDAVFITGSNPILIKARELGFDGPFISAQVFESPTYTGGTTLPYYNLSRVNPVAGTVQIKVSVTTTVTGTEVAAPTYAIGTDAQGQNNVGSVGTFTTPGLERVLKPNTTYLLRVNNPEANPQRIAAYITWYEGKLSSLL